MVNGQERWRVGNVYKINDPKRLENHVYVSKLKNQLYILKFVMFKYGGLSFFERLPYTYSDRRVPELY